LKSRVKTGGVFLLVFLFFGIHWTQKINPTVGPFNVTFLGKMERHINESSGICKSHTDTTFWTHNDGNYPEIFEITQHGKLLQSKPFQLEMTDFEEITKDSDGNIYLGDFGNNFSNRKNLAIHRYNAGQDAIDRSIFFSYPDQNDFSFSYKNGIFDCEAFFYFNDYLYLFSKNRNKEKPVRIYQLPTLSGRYEALIIDSARLKSPITGADISPSKEFFVLLTYKHLYIFKIKEGRITFDYPKGKYSLENAGQAEAICYVNENELIITNEGGRVYVLTLKE